MQVQLVGQLAGFSATAGLSAAAQELRSQLHRMKRNKRSCGPRGRARARAAAATLPSLQQSGIFKAPQGVQEAVQEDSIPAVPAAEQDVMLPCTRHQTVWR